MSKILPIRKNNIMKTLFHLSSFSIFLILPLQIYGSIASANIMVNKEGKKIILLGDLHDRVFHSEEKKAHVQEISDAIISYSGRKQISCILEISETNQKQLNELKNFGHTGLPVELLTALIEKRLHSNLSVIAGDARTMMISNVAAIFYEIYNYVELCKRHGLTIPQTDLIEKYLDIPQQTNSLEQIEIAEAELHDRVINTFYADMNKAIQIARTNQDIQLSQKIGECILKIQQLAKSNGNSLAKAIRSISVGDACDYALIMIDELFESACKATIKKSVSINDLTIVLCGHGHIDDMKKIIESLEFKLATSLGQPTNTINTTDICSAEDIRIVISEINYQEERDREAAARDTQKDLHACAWCNINLDKLLRCTQCKKVYYCNSQCQKNHWKTHKKTCSKS